MGYVNKHRNWTERHKNTYNSVQNQKRQYKSFILFLAFSCQMERVEDNKKSESGPILGQAATFWTSNIPN